MGCFSDVPWASQWYSKEYQWNMTMDTPCNTLVMCDTSLWLILHLLDEGSVDTMVIVECPWMCFNVP
jgi:hypothetical protein